VATLNGAADARRPNLQIQPVARASSLDRWARRSDVVRVGTAVGRTGRSCTARRHTSSLSRDMTAAPSPRRDDDDDASRPPASRSPPRDDFRPVTAESVSNLCFLFPDTCKQSQ
jgi:hypothetical protein